MIVLFSILVFIRFFVLEAQRKGARFCRQRAFKKFLSVGYLSHTVWSHARNHWTKEDKNHVVSTTKLFQFYCSIVQEVKFEEKKIMSLDQIFQKISDSGPSGSYFNFFANTFSKISPDLPAFYQCCGSGMLIPDPNFSIPDTDPHKRI